MSVVIFFQIQSWLQPDLRT